MILYQSSTVDIYNVSTALDIFPDSCHHDITLYPNFDVMYYPAFLKFHKRCAVVYSLKIGKKDTLILIYLCMLFVLQAGDCHPNPGPPRFPCYICEKACWWGQKAVACNQCNQWYHIHCIVIHTFSYTAKILFHQSPTRHSDYTVTTTVTMQSLFSSPRHRDCWTVTTSDTHVIRYPLLWDLCRNLSTRHLVGNWQSLHGKTLDTHYTQSLCRNQGGTDTRFCSLPLSF